MCGKGGIWLDLGLTTRSTLLDIYMPLGRGNLKDFKPHSFGQAKRIMISFRHILLLFDCRNTSFKKDKYATSIYIMNYTLQQITKLAFCVGLKN